MGTVLNESFSLELEMLDLSQLSEWRELASDSILSGVEVHSLDVKFGLAIVLIRSGGLLLLSHGGLSAGLLGHWLLL